MTDWIDQKDVSKFKRTLGKGATPDEMKLILSFWKATGKDPFQGEFVVYRDLQGRLKIAVPDDSGRIQLAA